jgi:hypothetical protein
MNEIIGVAVYVLLALVIAVGIRAVSKSRAGKQPNGSLPLTRPHVVARARIVKGAQSLNPNAKHEHALPWVIPTATAPAAPHTEKKKAPTSVEAISRRLDVVEARLGRIATRS